MAELKVLILAGHSHGAEPSNPAELAEQLLGHPDIAAAEVVEDLRGRRRRLGRLLPASVIAALGRGGVGMASRVNAFGPHVVVSWDPRIASVLGTRRAAGRFPIPLVAAAGDLHELGHLSGPGVDRYLLAWPVSVEAAEEIAGAGRVAIVAAPIDAAFLDPPARGASRGAVARQLKLSLKGGRPLIVVAGGAAGAGDIAGAATSAVQAVPDAAVVALAGDSAEREAELQARLSGIEQARVLGASDRLATLLAAADVLVDTAGGGGLEAAAVGCPVVGAGANLGSDLQAALEAERPAPLDLSTLETAADAVIAAAYGR